MKLFALCLLIVASHFLKSSQIDDIHKQHIDTQQQIIPSPLRSSTIIDMPHHESAIQRLENTVSQRVYPVATTFAVLGGVSLALKAVCKASQSGYMPPFVQLGGSALTIVGNATGTLAIVGTVWYAKHEISQMLHAKCVQQAKDRERQYVDAINDLNQHFSIRFNDLIDRSNEQQRSIIELQDGTNERLQEIYRSRNITNKTIESIINSIKDVIKTSTKSLDDQVAQMEKESNLPNLNVNKLTEIQKETLKQLKAPNNGCC